jgi:hypothetical protein
MATGSAALPRKPSGSSSGAASETAAAAGQGDPDLDGRQEPVGVAGDRGDHGAGPRVALEALELPLAQ